MSKPSLSSAPYRWLPATLLPESSKSAENNPFLLPFIESQKRARDDAIANLQTARHALQETISWARTELESADRQTFKPISSSNQLVEREEIRARHNAQRARQQNVTEAVRSRETACKMLAAEVTKLDNAIKCNVVLISPISRLPTELIYIILSFWSTPPTAKHDRLSITSDKHPLLAATSISRRWRTIALNNPRLWTYIHIYPSPADSKVMVLARTKLWFYRSGRAPLDIGVDAVRLIAPIVQILSPGFPRCYKLALDLGEMIPGVLKPLQKGCLSKVSDLELRCCDEGFTIQQLAQTLIGTPDITRLVLHTIHSGDDSDNEEDSDETETSNDKNLSLVSLPLLRELVVFERPPLHLLQDLHNLTKLIWHDLFTFEPLLTFLPHLRFLRVLAIRGPGLMYLRPSAEEAFIRVLGSLPVLEELQLDYPTGSSKLINALTPPVIDIIPSSAGPSRPMFWSRSSPISVSRPGVGM